MHPLLSGLVNAYFGGITPIPSVRLGDGALEEALALWQHELRGMRVAVVSDPNTFAVAGQRVCNALQGADWQFEAPPKASLAVAEDLASRARAIDLVIAVGSGTINDLCKYASYKAGKPYRVIATAPSMNGYVSANASLLVEEHKSSFKAHLPHALVADLQILRSAPDHLIAAGAGDSLCLPTVRTDWNLARLIAGVPYDASAIEMQAVLWEGFIADPEGLAARTSKAVEGLMLLLIASGLAMTHAGGSQPASQGEHMVAHTVEMLYPDWSQRLLHGQWIALTTLMMAEHQEHLLSQPGVTLKTPLGHHLLEVYFGTKAGGACHEAMQEKMAFRDVVTNRLAEWERVRAELAGQFVSASKLRQFGERAGVLPDYRPYTEMLRSAFELAPYTRNRLTFLDLV